MDVGSNNQGLNKTAAPRVNLCARGVTIHYWVERANAAFLAVDGIDVDIKEGEFVAILGPSGCGKTTFINAVSGTQPISGGSLTLDGNEINGPGPDRAMVFQQASLLPWRSVLDNVLFGAKLQRRIDREEREARARHLIKLVGLGGFEKSYPSELSGGMQQRVNLARALTTNPRMLLLDEPFAALDAQTRELMQDELLRVWEEEKTTALFITHDIKEAVFLADRVIVFSARPGRIKREVEVDLPRPRGRETRRSDRFREIEDLLHDSIQEEVLAAAKRELARGAS